MKTNVLKSVLLTFLIIISFLQEGKAAEPVRVPAGPDAPAAVTGLPVATCKPGVSRTDLDINNVRARYMNQGDMFWDPAASLARYEVPKRTDNTTTSKNSVFAAAIWIGGLDKSTGTSNLLVMAQTYRGSFRNYWPGPIQYDNPDNGIPTKDKVCLAWDQHFKCNRKTVVDYVDYMAGNVPPFSVIPNEIKYWPGKGNPFLKQKAEFTADPAARNSLDHHSLANFFDADTNGIYNPALGDFPLWAGTEKDAECGTDVRIAAGADQVIWWVCNDGGNTKNFPSNTIPIGSIGMEVHYEAFAYAATDATNDMTFLRQKLFNYGPYILDSTYMAQWMDPDLGYANDDYVGCDVMRGLAICYNGDDFDEGSSGYGENPPALGVDFFRGPFPDDPLDEIDWDRDCRGPVPIPPDTSRDIRERITMSGFIYYNIGGHPRNGDPVAPNHFYNYLRNKWKDGSDISYDGGAGLDPVSSDKPKAKFMFPRNSDPYGFGCGDATCANPIPCKSGWSEESAGNAKGDRRFLANNGPFTLQPGALNECTIGIVWARTGSGGAQGSFGKLLSADDLAQQRFDECFQRNVGPNNPNLEILESGQSLVFNIIPDTIARNPTVMTTETYTELNRKVKNSTNGEDIYYRFQGYKIYQLVDDRVSVQDLDNPDKARFLKADINGDGEDDLNGIMDLQDGTKTISNEEYVQAYDQTLLVAKVKNTPDLGIFHSFQVTKDLFASSSGGTLSDFSKYYYAIVAYGFNDNSDAKQPYIQGVGNYKIYTAIPHSYVPQSFGTVVPGKFGQGFDITRVRGLGNSGNSLTLAAGEEQKILDNLTVDRLTYEGGKSPIDIKVYNPNALKDSKFQVSLSCRLRYTPPQGGYHFQVGDVVRSSGNLISRPNWKLTNRVNFLPGKGIVNRVAQVTGSADSYDLDISLIGNTNGTWAYQLDETYIQNSNEFLLTSEVLYTDVVLVSDPNIFYPTTEYVAYDFWKLKNLTNNTTIYSEKPISSISEQLIPEYGISLRMKPGVTPGVNPFSSIGTNGALVSEIAYTEPPFWTYGISNNQYPFLRTDDFAGGALYHSLDPKRGFFNAAGGSWAPYAISSIGQTGSASTGLKGGPQLPADKGSDVKSNYDVLNPDVIQSMSRLQNVDVVLTPDQSKWTKCIVLQNDVNRCSAFNKNALMLSKSLLPSVDKAGVPIPGAMSPYTGASLPSTGMGWFPGYAIDLDKGQRLNMMFAESATSDIDNGNNLVWEPVFPQGSKSFIYVTNSVYDESRNLEAKADEILDTYAKGCNFNVDNFYTKQREFYIDNLMWVGLMGRVPKDLNSLFPLNSSVVRANLRVERSFEAFANVGKVDTTGDFNPIYEFEISGQAAKFGEVAVGSSALDMIRVVPNPYYSVSGYETSQIDNRVKIVNIPSQCVISIFNLSGSLVRQFNFNQSNVQGYVSNQNGVNVQRTDGFNYQTFQDWDLKNQKGLPIASGVYIIHVKSDKLGEKIIKWFGVLRPIDLDSFN